MITFNAHTYTKNISQLIKHGDYINHQINESVLVLSVITKQTVIYRHVTLTNNPYKINGIGFSIPSKILSTLKSHINDVGCISLLGEDFTYTNITKNYTITANMQDITGNYNKFTGDSFNVDKKQLINLLQATEDKRINLCIKGQCLQVADSQGFGIIAGYNRTPS